MPTPGEYETAQARILALRAESDESLNLVARGGTTKYANDLENVIIPKLGGKDGQSVAYSAVEQERARLRSAHAHC